MLVDKSYLVQEQSKGIGKDVQVDLLLKQPQRDVI